MILAQGSTKKGYLRPSTLTAQKLRGQLKTIIEGILLAARGDENMSASAWQQARKIFAAVDQRLVAGVFPAITAAELQRLHTIARSR